MLPVSQTTGAARDRRPARTYARRQSGRWVSLSRLTVPASFDERDTGVTTVAITGVGGRVGRRVLEAVRALPAVDAVVGVVPPADDPGASDESGSAGADVRVADVTDLEATRAALAGADVVVHLPADLVPPGGRERAREVHVDGTRHVAEAARTAGARKLVVVTSTVAYGAHPDNEVPLTEESPLRANPDFPWAEQEREVDTWLGGWAERHDDVVVTRLRVATVVGDGVDTVLTRALLAPRLPSVRGHRPPWQFVHVDDAASAVTHAVTHDLAGAYNVAAEGWLSFDEVAAILDRRPLDLPEEVAFSTVERLGAIGLSDLPIGAVHYVMHPWVVSSDRLVATGWRPVHSNRDAAAALAADLGDRIVLGPVATSRRQVRQTAAVSAGVAGGLLALGVMARRRRRSS